jgi:hypothetical protein
VKNSARTELDSVVVNIELTLTSIIQGVALAVLAESARDVMFARAFWPYIAAGLLIILIFWSRSILHTLTLIRWPLEFGHNFFYIACGLGEALLFSRLQNPYVWFVLTMAYAAVVWPLFIYDSRLIRARMRDSSGAAGQALYSIVGRDQRLNIVWLIPGLILFNALCAVCLRASPQGWFRDAHTWLAVLQATALSVYLGYVVRFFTKIAPLIAKVRQEWRERSESGRTD